MIKELLSGYIIAAFGMVVAYLSGNFIIGDILLVLGILIIFSVIGYAYPYPVVRK